MTPQDLERLRRILAELRGVRDVRVGFATWQVPR